MRSPFLGLIKGVLTDIDLNQVIVNSMHERKVAMAQRVQGFVGLPGGFGTFEEVI